MHVRGVIDSDISDMPWLIVDARDFRLVLGITDNKAVFVTVFRQPLSFRRFEIIVVGGVVVAHVDGVA